jgi:hypothetical protein
MSNDDLHVCWTELTSLGWGSSLNATHRMWNKGRFPRPFRFDAATGHAIWRYRDVLPFIRKPHLARR